MDSSKSRYDVICDPLDMWMVWDHQAEEPACFGGQILHGLTERHAVEVAKIMNEIYGSGSARTGRAPTRAGHDTTFRYVRLILFPRRLFHPIPIARGAHPWSPHA
jgi:hypothetical protein